uniref:(northern house mosquito) hypothetical protein n=1 Tax=Culex pipiens TaxID=7175 RepID=A0A8D8MF32_CULPI
MTTSSKRIKSPGNMFRPSWRRLRTTAGATTKRRYCSVRSVPILSLSAKNRPNSAPRTVPERAGSRTRLRSCRTMTCRNRCCTLTVASTIPRSLCSARSRRWSDWE